MLALCALGSCQAGLPAVCLALHVPRGDFCTSALRTPTAILVAFGSPEVYFEFSDYICLLVVFVCHLRVEEENCHLVSPYPYLTAPVLVYHSLSAKV